MAKIVKRRESATLERQKSYQKDKKGGTCDRAE